MRLRHVKDAYSIINSSSYVIKNFNDFKGDFKSIFNNDNEIHIEIGMGKGDFIIGMAEKYPDINFIGIEKFDSVIVRAVEKLENLEIPNLRLIRMDALYIDDVFDKEVSKIYLNFSDPWPKKRHADRRLTSSVFLKKYDKIFIGNPMIVQKTDNRELFEYSVVTLSNYGYKINDLSLDLHSKEDYNNIMTEYEDKFSRKGCKIYMLNASKSI